MACILVVFMVFGLGYVQRRRCQQTSGCLWQWQLLKGPEPRDCIHHALSLFAWNESNTAETAFNWLTVFNERALDWIVCQYGNKTVLRLGLTNSNNAASVWLIMSLLYSQTIVFCLVIVYLSIVKIFKRFFLMMLPSLVLRPSLPRPASFLLLLFAALARSTSRSSLGVHEPLARTVGAGKRRQIDHRSLSSKMK